MKSKIYSFLYNSDVTFGFLLMLWYVTAAGAIELSKTSSWRPGEIFDGAVLLGCFFGFCYSYGCVQGAIYGYMQKQRQARFNSGRNGPIAAEADDTLQTRRTRTSEFGSTGQENGMSLINPATGLPMINGEMSGLDIHGNAFGTSFNEPSFDTTWDSSSMNYDSHCDSSSWDCDNSWDSSSWDSSSSFDCNSHSSGCE